MSHSLYARRRARCLGTLVTLGLCALAVSGTAAATGGPKGGTHAIRQITVLSNRADLISGGDALVAIDLGRSRASSIRVTLNGSDVTSAFAVRPNGRYEGLVTGLVNGKNVLRAVPKHGHGRQITIRNHPIGGPVFAGPQVTPFFCNPNVSNPPLGAAIDAQCNAPTKVELLYRNTATPAQFVAYDPDQSAAGSVDRPDDHGRR